MVDSVGTGNQVSRALMPEGGKKVEKSSGEGASADTKETNFPTSPSAIDEVSLSNEAMDIASTQQVVQEARSQLAEDDSLTLSSDMDRLNTLV